MGKNQMRRRAKILAAGFVLGLRIASGQPCVSQAMRTIEHAMRHAASGDVDGAHRLLQRAEAEYPISSAVFQKLAEAYELLGDGENAARAIGMAKRLDPRADLAREARRSPGDTAGDKSFVREKWALVVGIGKFRDPSIPELEFAAKDAKDIAQVLLDAEVGRFRDDGMHVRVLTDEQATLANLRAEINYITRNAREEDLVVLHMSSHGTSPADDVAAKPEGQTGYIVTYDTDTSNLYGTAFPMEELKRVVVDRLRARRVVTFLDTCFSGDTVRWARGGKALTIIPPASFQGIAQGTGRVVITSSLGTEKSWEGDGNCYFAKCLIETLKRKSGLSTIT
jgi:hypothetical protein